MDLTITPFATEEEKRRIIGPFVLNQCSSIPVELYRLSAVVSEPVDGYMILSEGKLFHKRIFTANTRVEYHRSAESDMIIAEAMRRIG